MGCVVCSTIMMFCPCRRQCIDLGMLADKLNMEPEAAEKWIVNLIRSARLSAKLDSQARSAAVLLNPSLVSGRMFLLRLSAEMGYRADPDRRGCAWHSLPRHAGTLARFWLWMGSTRVHDSLSPISGFACTSGHVCLSVCHLCDSCCWL